MSTQTPEGFGSGAEPGAGSGSGAINDPSTNPTTVVANDPAAGSPQGLASFQPPAGHPNPYIDAGPFGKVTIGGLVLPGIVDNIDGARAPEEWTQQKGTGSSGTSGSGSTTTTGGGANFATSVWKGSKLAEGIEVVLALHDAVSYDAAYRVRDLLRPTRGKKPPSHRIDNATINFPGILRITIADIEAPKWQKSGGHWLWKLTLNEYNPSANAATGPADPTKPADGTTPGAAAGAEAGYVLGQVKNA